MDRNLLKSEQVYTRFPFAPPCPGNFMKTNKLTTWKNKRKQPNKQKKNFTKTKFS